MKDDLSELYLESVANPAKLTKKIDHGKTGLVGNVKMEKDLGAAKKGFQKKSGPEAAKGTQKAKELKEEKEMNEPVIGSQFDNLFKRTIKEDFETNDAPSAEFAGEDEFGGDELGDETGEFGGDELGDEQPADETDLRTALTNIIDQLQGILSNIEGEGEGEGEGEFGDDEGASDDEPSDIEDLDAASNESDDLPFGEDAQMPAQKTRDGKISKAPDGKSGLQGKNNKVGGYFGKKSGGSASDHGSDSKPRDGKLRPGPDYKSLQSKGNMTVKQSGSPGKQGANLF